MCQSIKEKIFEIRKFMRASDLDFVVIPQSDPHLSEYLADSWKFREWASGFSGSAGTLVVGAGHAGIWTDSRYFIQARKELSESGVHLHEMHDAATNYPEWLRNALREGEKIGLDGRVFSVNRIRKLKKMATGEGAELIVDITRLYDVWKERPPLPATKVFDYDVRYAGLPRKDKLERIREEMRQQDVEWHLITALDDVAWTFNLRGRDVEYNPVFYGFGLIGMEDAYLFTQSNKISEVLLRELERDGVYTAPYDKAYHLSDLVDDRILIDPDGCNYLVFQQFGRGTVQEGPSIPGVMKAIKGQIEIMHIRDAMIKDGVALTRAFKWLEDNLEGGDITEFDFAKKIGQCRAEQEGYFGESFPAIVGYNENGAVVHYRPHRDTSSTIRGDGILLCDSGAQYIDGTTDITRTIALSAPLPEIKRDFTRVLKGHIALDAAHFPVGTTGIQLDALARQFLWQDGKNYGHGTGHGVGYFLNVHEGPQGYSYGKSSRASTPLEEGMLSSNEPGFYLEGRYGIRLENLVLVVSSEFSGYLMHEHLTLFPFDLRLIERSMLTEAEVQWVNSYHTLVVEALGPRLDDEHLRWLQEKCTDL